jgi:hypothetical protein
LGDCLLAGRSQGLLDCRRRVEEGQERAPLVGKSLSALSAEFQGRGAARTSLDAAGRLRWRDAVLREAGVRREWTPLVEAVNRWVRER